MFIKQFYVCMYSIIEFKLGFVEEIKNMINFIYNN